MGRIPHSPFRTGTALFLYSSLGWTIGAEADLQGWLVMAFVCAERMARTGRTGQTCQIGVAGPTMLALVFELLAALIQGVFAFVRASRGR
jgi:hypothetical protein